MTRSYSNDLRERVVCPSPRRADPLGGGTVRCQRVLSAEVGGALPSAGSVAPDGIGDHRPWLREPHRERVHALVAATPHLTLDRLQEQLASKGTRTSVGDPEKRSHRSYLRGLPKRPRWSSAPVGTMAIRSLGTSQVSSSGVKGRHRSAGRHHRIWISGAQKRTVEDTWQHLAIKESRECQNYIRDAGHGSALDVSCLRQ